MGRRAALVTILAGIGAMASSAVALLLGFISNSLGRRRAHPWMRVGPAEDLDSETFQKYVFRLESRHAWIRERTPIVVYIKDLYPDDPVALLSTCSHLGCSVGWHSADGLFRCPCHGGTYDEHGEVLAGPPPRPLTRLEVKIENDVCHVRLPDPRV